MRCSFLETWTRFGAAGVISLVVLLCPEPTSIFAGAGQPKRDPALAGHLVVLDDAVRALANPDADYRKILGGALSRSPRGSLVETALATFLSHVPEAGADFRCGAEFMRRRARQELWRIKDTLLDFSPPPPEPQFCYAIPVVIDMERPIGAVEVYGYDMERAPVEIFVMDNDGFFRDATASLIKRSDQHVTINLGKDGVTFSPKDQTLAVAWGHIVRYSIPLIHSATPLCQSRIEDVPEKAITYPPQVIQGDGVFRAPRANVWASATLDYESNKVDATVCMSAAEQGRDGTTLNGCGVEYVFTSEPERVIEWVFGGLQSQITYVHDSRLEEVKDGVRGQPVRRWTFSGFGGISPSATETRVTAQLGRIRVVSTETERCVSPIAYTEAKRTKVVSPGTRKRLDAEMGRTDPDILKVRPRFAPSGP